VRRDGPHRTDKRRGGRAPRHPHGNVVEFAPRPGLAQKRRPPQLISNAILLVNSNARYRVDMSLLSALAKSERCGQATTPCVRPHSVPSYRPPTPEAIGRPVRRSRAREPLTAPTRVSPAPTTEYEQHDEDDQYGLHGHGSSPPATALYVAVSWRTKSNRRHPACLVDQGPLGELDSARQSAGGTTLRMPAMAYAPANQRTESTVRAPAGRMVEVLVLLLLDLLIGLLEHLRFIALQGTILQEELLAEERLAEERLSQLLALVV
jgi:hypothetical protein